MNFNEWLEHWGEARLAEIIAGSQECYRSKWEARDGSCGPWQYPAWELCVGAYWEESSTDWHSRWQRCGGQLYDGRMIAAKWDGIWARLSGTFPDGLGQPYPPYARSSCAHWVEIGQDEAIVIGAITESKFNDYMARFPREPLMDKDGQPIPKELIQAALEELQEHIYRNGGPRPGASREERVAHERKQREERREKQTAIECERIAQQPEMRRKHEEWVTNFSLLADVEKSLDEPEIDESRMIWLCESIQKLTSTSGFEGFQDVRPAAWIAAANLHQHQGNKSDELDCLRYALKLDPKAPVKRRVKALEKLLSENPLTG